MPLRLINVNFQSIKNKKPQLLNLINSMKPDIIVGTETWLTPEHHSSEFFPINQFEIFRRDRPNNAHGGVLIATSREFIFDEVPELNSECEGLWVKTSIAGQPNLYIGAFYRPDQNPKHLEALNESLNNIRAIPNKSIVLAGDFNLPHMDWETPCHISGKPLKNEHESCLDILFEHGLENVVRSETHEAGNTLDLIITNRPGAVNRIRDASRIWSKCANWHTLTLKVRQ